MIFFTIFINIIYNVTQNVVVESGDTNEDAEARSLLNKFLGASVILYGMEQGAKSPTSSSVNTTTSTTSSATLVNRVEKQRNQVSNTFSIIFESKIIVKQIKPVQQPPFFASPVTANWLKMKI